MKVPKWKKNYINMLIRLNVDRTQKLFFDIIHYHDSAFQSFILSNYKYGLMLEALGDSQVIPRAPFGYGAYF